MRNVVNRSRIYDDLNFAAKNLEDFFAHEVRCSIRLDRLSQIVNRDISGVKVQIVNLLRKDKESKTFTLSSDKETIMYRSQRADENNLYNHEGELILALTKEGHRIVRRYGLKGKFQNMYINYEKKLALVENDIEALKYAIANPEIIDIKLLENICSDSEKIKLWRRKVHINLNRHRLALGSIIITDSELYISNGVLDCSRDLRNWIFNNNEYNFIWTNKWKKCTSLYLEDVFVSEDKLTDISSDPGGKAAVLIGSLSREGKEQVDRIMIKKSFFKLKAETKACETYILNTNGKENIIVKNNFHDSDKVIKVKGGEEPVFAIVLANLFNNISTKLRNIITVVSSRNRKYPMINGTSVESGQSMEKLKFNALEVGEALLYFRNKGNENDFAEGCTIEIYGDESGNFNKSLSFQNGRWREKVPPSLIADRVNNDMQHNILIRFTPQKEWSDNITKIIVLNSRGRVLGRDQYQVDGERGIITLYNVHFDKVGRPYFEGLLETGINYVLIKAKDFEDNWLCQDIRPIQIVEVKNGIGKAVTKIMDKGSYKLKAALISNGRKIEIKRPVKIEIR